MLPNYLCKTWKSRARLMAGPAFFMFWNDILYEKWYAVKGHGNNQLVRQKRYPGTNFRNKCS